MHAETTLTAVVNANVRNEGLIEIGSYLMRKNFLLFLNWL